MGKPTGDSKSAQATVPVLFLIFRTFTCMPGQGDGWAGAKWLHRFSSLNDSDQHHNDGDDQQDMNEPTHGVAGHQSQQPQNTENHKYGPKHVRLLSEPSEIFLEKSCLRL
jgi:hypothetical protein